MNLFSHNNNCEEIHIPIKDATIIYYPFFMTKKRADSIFKELLEQVSWQQDNIKLFGKTHPQPRLTALYGNENKAYRYSGITMYPSLFTPTLKELKNNVENISNKQFNTVLLNLYRNGKDSNGWHSDNEKELGDTPVIASISLGAKRCFQLKHKKDKSLKYQLFLEHGSLLLMMGETQNYWKHQLPKSKKITESRINLTYRNIL